MLLPSRESTPYGHRISLARRLATFQLQSEQSARIDELEAGE